MAVGFGASGNAAGEEVPELQLAQAWSVEYPERLDLSGLTLVEGVLFAVSDKVDEAIFRLELDRAVARAVRAVDFTVPEPLPAIGRLDWEAITITPDGDFLLASEWGFAAAAVPRSGGAARWVTPNIRSAGVAVGLFAVPNGYVEGLAVLGPGHFLFVGERQPRGFVEVRTRAGTTSVVAQVDNESRFPLRAGRELDWTDLFVWRDRVFALARNQALVVELIRLPSGQWREDRAWSYNATESDDSYRYADMTFGMGEGLAMSDEMVYVLLDNNGVSRAGTEADQRPWLFGFLNPLGTEIDPPTAIHR